MEQVYKLIGDVKVKDIDKVNEILSSCDSDVVFFKTLIGNLEYGFSLNSYNISREEFLVINSKLSTDGQLPFIHGYSKKELRVENLFELVSENEDINSITFINYTLGEAKQLSKKFIGKNKDIPTAKPKQRSLFRRIIFKIKKKIT